MTKDMPRRVNTTIMFEIPLEEEKQGRQGEVANILNSLHPSHMIHSREAILCIY